MFDENIFIKNSKNFVFWKIKIVEMLCSKKFNTFHSIVFIKTDIF